MADFIVAITGGVASGKSEVSRAFEALGRVVVDADLIARELVEPGQPALAEIRACFGPDAVSADGRLDRGWLRKHVFEQAAERQRLEAILHPRIRAALQARAVAADGPYALIAVPLLTEGGGRRAYPWVDRILVIDAPEAVQRQRLLARDGGSAELATRMLAAQASRSARLAVADDVLVNDGPLAGLGAVVAALDRRYLQLGYNAGLPPATRFKTP